MARPQIYVHPCLDLVPPLSMGSLIRSLLWEGEGRWRLGASVSANNGPDSESERSRIWRRELVEVVERVEGGLALR